MKRSLAILVLAALLPAAAIAQSTRTYECSSGALTRRLVVAYLGAGEVPCEVRYSKEGEETQVLWHAGIVSGYCEVQARDFIVKLQGLGWTCADIGSAPVAAAPVPPTDDTAALGAGR